MNGNGKKYLSNGRLFFGDSRSEKMAKNRLGYLNETSNKKKSRSTKLDLVESYYNGTQYKGKIDWDSALKSEDFVAISDRAPKIVFPFADVFSERISSKIAGHGCFPKTKIEEDPESDYFSKIIIEGGFLRPRLLGAAKLLALYNSVFVRFYFSEGVLKVENYNSNYCYPIFLDNGSLDSLEIKYVYSTGESDTTGKEIKKWYKLFLSRTVDIEYDSPELVESSTSEPEFQEVSRNEHNLGFVQGEWFSFGESVSGFDGDRDPFIYKIAGFIDAINYNLSQTDQATRYGLEPQLVLSGMSTEEIDGLIKSSAKAWSLGRDGQAQFVEVSGSGIETAGKVNQDLFHRVQSIARVIMLDPEKVAGYAQSGKAMETLHGPFVELVNEIRPWFEKGYASLLEKIITSVVLLNNSGFQTQFMMPEGWVPQSLNIKISWPPVFDLTTQDKQQIVSLAIQSSNANLISRDTALRYLQSQGVDFGVEDFELEAQKIATQPRFNTWGF